MRNILSDDERRGDVSDVIMPDGNDDIYDDKDDLEDDANPWIKPKLFLFIGGIIVVILVFIFIMTGGSGVSEVTIDRIHNIEMRIAQLEGKISSFTDLNNRISELEGRTVHLASANTPEVIRSMHSIDKRIEKLENDILRLASNTKISASSDTTTDSVSNASVPQTKKADTTVFHTVKKGETLYSIAKTYGVPVSTIQQLNKLGNSSIKVGQRLVVK